MAVPDHFFLVQQTYNTGHYDLTLHDDQARFVDDVAIALHAYDPNWGHLKKKPGQTQIHGHAEDAALYKLGDGTAQAVDFIGGAGGPNPTLRWGVDSFIYAYSDWLDPADHENGEPPEPPAPISQPYPDEGSWWLWVFDVEVGKRYAQAGQPYPNNSMAFRWASRTAYDIGAGMTKEDSLAKHLKELEAALGIAVP